MFYSILYPNVRCTTPERIEINGTLARSEPNPSRHLDAQSQQWKHQESLWNLFRFNNKDTWTTSMMSFWCLCCYLWTDFTYCSGVSHCWLWACKCRLGWNKWLLNYIKCSMVTKAMCQLNFYSFSKFYINPLSANPTKR